MASRRTCQGVQQEVISSYGRVARSLPARPGGLANDPLPCVGSAVLYEGVYSALLREGVYSAVLYGGVYSAVLCEGVYSAVLYEVCTQLCYMKVCTLLYYVKVYTLLHHMKACTLLYCMKVCVTVLRFVLIMGAPLKCESWVQSSTGLFKMLHRPDYLSKRRLHEPSLSRAGTNHSVLPSVVLSELCYCCILCHDCYVSSLYLSYALFLHIGHQRQLCFLRRSLCCQAPGSNSAATTLCSITQPPTPKVASPSL